MGVREAICKAGLHARPAAVFVKAVLDSGHAVRVGRRRSRPEGESGEGRFVDARSIVSVLALDIQPGEAVVLRGDDNELLERLAGLLEADQ